MKKISKRRKEMGEEKWAEYQIERTKKKQRTHIAKNPEKAKEKLNYAVFWRARAKAELIRYKGGKCILCGYCKEIPRVFDFHHRDPKNKEFTIGQYSILNMEKLKTEVDKCDLLCKNCHAELHDKEYIEIRKVMKEKHDKPMAKIGVKYKIICKICKKEIESKDYKQVYCSNECHGIGLRKVKDRPSKEQLENDIQELPMTKIGKKYGVSDNAVRKWIKKNNL